MHREILVKRFLLFLVLMGPQLAHAQDLDASQINEELVGRSITWSDANGWASGSLVLMPSGKAEITVTQPQEASDAGQWTLDGNAICTAWNSMRQGLTKCYSVRETKPGHFVTSGGNEFEIRYFGV